MTAKIVTGMYTCRKPTLVKPKTDASQPHWKIATVRRIEAAVMNRFITTALRASARLRNMASKNRNDEPRTSARTRGGAGACDVGGIDEFRRRSLSHGDISACRTGHRVGLCAGCRSTTRRRLPGVHLQC